MNRKLAYCIKRYKKTRNMGNRLEIQWVFMFLELLAFRKKNKHTNVPALYEKNRSLGRWVRRQRYLHTSKKIDGMREELLTLASFNFRLLPVHDWDKMFGKLIAFKEKYGHVHITQSHQDVKLYDWITYQRKLFWRKKLDAGKVKKLKSISVEMQNKTEGRWEKMFSQLVNFKRRHGHLYVCKYYKADQQLINFVRILRKNRNNIAAERSSKLNKIGFIWNPGKELTRKLNRKRADKAWGIRFEELKAYKRKFGTSKIAVADKEYPALGRWASVQRCRKEMMPQYRFKSLKKIDFWVDNKM